MLAMEGVDKERNRLLLVTYTTQEHLVKLTCWMLAMGGADKKRNQLLLINNTHIHNTRPFSKTHRLMLAMEGAEKERNKLLLVKQTHT